MPEKGAKARCTRSRLSCFRKAGRAFGIGTFAMLVPPRTPPPIPNFSSQHSSCHVEIVGCAGEGFNRRGSISVLRSNAPDLISLGAPKLSACAVGIESVRYDFDRFLLSQRPISLGLTLLFPQLLKILRSRKVTSSIRNRRAHQRDSPCLR